MTKIKVNILFLTSLLSFSAFADIDVETSTPIITRRQKLKQFNDEGINDAQSLAKELQKRLVEGDLGSKASLRALATHPLFAIENQRITGQKRSEALSAFMQDPSNKKAKRNYLNIIKKENAAEGLHQHLNEALLDVYKKKHKKKRKQLRNSLFIDPAAVTEQAIPAKNKHKRSSADFIGISKSSLSENKNEEPLIQNLVEARTLEIVEPILSTISTPTPELDQSVTDSPVTTLKVPEPEGYLQSIWNSLTRWFF